MDTCICKHCCKAFNITEFPITSMAGYRSRYCYSCLNKLPDTPTKKSTSKGYIYVLVDVMYPQFIKIGRTVNLRRRLRNYNNVRPLATCSYIKVSKQFVDVAKIEDVILHEISKQFVSVTNGSLEWFPVEAKAIVLTLVAQADLEGQ